jgi:DNA repair protein RecN (Recombination protein N)
VIRQLQISNYAIIDHIEVNFQAGLNIITGETGAGKSILMGALSLILGARADTSVLKSADKKCVVECSFMVNGQKAIEGYLEAADLKEPGDLIVRREIAASGKSRAFINDTPVTLQQLKELAVLLVDQHQQFDTLQLGESDFQRQVVDALAGNKDRIAGFQQTYKNLQSVRVKLVRLEEEKASFDKEADFNQYLFDELSELNLQKGELEELDNELNLLSNAEEIKLALAETTGMLSEGEQPIVQTLRQLCSKLDHYQTYHEGLSELSGRLKSTQIELQDIAQELEGLSDHFNPDQQRISIIQERLDKGYKLFKKHSVSTTDELLLIQADLQNKLDGVLDTASQIEDLKEEEKKLLTEALKQADAITKARLAEVKPLQEAVNKRLASVGMPSARIQVNIIKETVLNAFGQDQVEFLFDANKSGKFEPIRKVASGGELSRLMLCIKSLVAQTVELPTLIFDEIDTGISGEAARQVGIIMKELSEKIQVIAITHQPQIAARAAHHLYVFKRPQPDTSIRTDVRSLAKDERILTIAQMLGGENPSTAALESAREMIESY